jgi:hypothetical protein
VGRQMTERSRAILQSIVDGKSYEQIISSGAADCYPEIFKAAAEALALAGQPREKAAHDDRLVAIRQKYPRAYKKWTPEEDAQLTDLFRSGSEAKDIAGILQRQPSAISSRLIKLGLVSLQPQAVLATDDGAPA